MDSTYAIYHDDIRVRSVLAWIFFKETVEFLRPAYRNEIEGILDTTQVFAAPITKCTIFILVLVKPRRQALIFQMCAARKIHFCGTHFNYPSLVTGA